MLKKQIIKFLIVGIINTIWGYSVYALFIYLGCDYKIASLVATILGVLFNFKTTGKLVFNSHDNRLIFKFVAVYAILYFFGIGLLKLIKTFIIDDDYIAGLIGLGPGVTFSFVLNKCWVFKK